MTKRNFTFYDKNLIKIEANFTYENNERFYFGANGIYDLVPLDEYQKELIELNKKYFGWDKAKCPDNIWEITCNCIDKAEKNNLKSLKKLNLDLDDILEETENFANSLTKNVIDSRDIQLRIDRLNLAKILGLLNEDYLLDELKKLEEFKEDCKDSNGDRFEFGQTIVYEDYFEDYAKEQAESCGYMNRGSNGRSQNPLENHIDWESWAEALKEDYTEVEYCGEYFYVY